MTAVADDPSRSGERDRPHTSPTVLVATLSTIGIVVSLMQTLVVPLIPSLPTLLDTTATNASWVITVTLLASAVCTPISGRLGDMFGKRRILLIDLTAMVIGSVLCAMSSSLPLSVAGRALQGVAIGAIPLGISILRDELPPERVGSAMAVMSSTLGVGSAIGLPVAALIAENADWHVLFWAAAAMGAAGALLIFRFVPESPVRTPAPFDFGGAAGLATALLALLLAITQGAQWGWTSASILTLFAVAILVFLGWGRYELVRRNPLVDLRVSARPRVLFTNIASIAVGFALYGMSLSFPQLLMAPAETGYGLGMSMVAAGLALAPSGCVMMLLSPVSARISARFGPALTLGVGAAVIGLGYLCAAAMMDTVWQIMFASILVAGGVGLAYAAMPALIMGAVPITETAAANGLNALMRSVGTSTSAAVMSAVLANMTITLGTRQLPSRDAFQTAFLISVTAAGIAIALTALIPLRAPATDAR
ncbi:MFS transporter [Nocardia testacea]|uniref:MFS transporter n=1 Tax=Nocardia testacea TaxID=248551 RepID=A0ABW7W578_9NOCA